MTITVSTTISWSEVNGNNTVLHYNLLSAQQVFPQCDKQKDNSIVWWSFIKPVLMKTYYMVSIFQLLKTQCIWKKLLFKKNNLKNTVWTSFGEFFNLAAWKLWLVLGSTVIYLYCAWSIIPSVHIATLHFFTYELVIYLINHIYRRYAL